jgi:hypothetical protein
MKRILIILPFLAACATSSEYTAYLQAQQEANRQAAETQKPLVRLTAQPGQQITGLQSLEVYTPTAAPVIQQQRPNEWAAVVQSGLGVVGTLGGVALGGKAAIGMAREIKEAGTAGYSFVQAPGTVTTTTTTIDTTHAPTVVTAPDPVIVTQPAPVIVTTPDPVVVRPEVVTTEVLK